MTDELPEYLTTADVAERYRKTAESVRYWRHVGYGPKSVKAGGKVLYPREEIQRFDRELMAQARGRSDAAA